MTTFQDIDGNQYEVEHFAPGDSYPSSVTEEVAGFPYISLNGNDIPFGNAILGENEEVVGIEPQEVYFVTDGQGYTALVHPTAFENSYTRVEG